MFSVALSRAAPSPERRVGVTHHRVLPCSDFPPGDPVNTVHRATTRTTQHYCRRSLRDMTSRECTPNKQLAVDNKDHARAAAG